MSIHFFFSDAALANRMKDAGHAVEEFALTETQKAVAFAKQHMGDDVKAAINDATTTSLPVIERLEKVALDIAPDLLKLATTGGFSGELADVKSLAKELAQSVFDDVKSTTAGNVASAILTAIKTL